MIDIQALPLGGVSQAGGSLKLGALVTLAALRREEAGGQVLNALREAAGGYANLALQNRSTVGGRVAQGRGDQDVPAALCALGARVHLSTASGEQVIDYPFGSARSQLEGALVTAVEIPLGEGKSAHRRFGRTAVDAPLACVSACLRGAELRLVANVQGAGADALRRLSETESLVGTWNGERRGDWRASVRQTCMEELSDYACPWVTAEYRRDLTATLAVRALAAVLGEEELA